MIDPFLCLLQEAVFRFGFCCESIDSSSHNESPKPPGFGIFNSSSCAPVKSGGTSLYSKSDSVPTIPVHFFHTSFCLDSCLSQRRKLDFARYLEVFSMVYCSTSYFWSSFFATEKSTTIAGSTGLSITPRSTALSMASLILSISTIPARLSEATSRR